MRLATLCSIVVFASGAASADGPNFDAASVRLTRSDVRPPFTITGGPGTSDPGRFRAPRINMLNLLSKAFGVNVDQITGPAWVHQAGSANSYSVEATMPGNTTKEQFQMMLQNLLIERFHLVFHRETRPFPGYDLVVDKRGPNRVLKSGSFAYA